jgi:hypothetical protein
MVVAGSLDAGVKPRALDSIEECSWWLHHELFTKARNAIKAITTMNKKFFPI